MALEPAIVVLLIIVVIIIIIALLLYSSVYIVHQGTGIVVERLGRFEKVFTPGWNFMIPFLQSPRNFSWRETGIGVDGHIYDKIISSYVMDLRENVFNFLELDVLTKDTILLSVNSIMYFRIVNPRMALYQIDDLTSSLQNTAHAQLKEVFGNMNFHEALTSQAAINQYLASKFEKLFSGWGIKVIRLEMLDIGPSGTAKGTAENMRKQIIAERHRRGVFIRSEGQKAAMNLRAEGAKQVQRILGMAEQESLRTVSTGKKDGAILEASAEKNALETVMMIPGGSDYLIAQQYLNMVHTMIHRIEDKTIYLPFNPNLACGCIKYLKAVFGSHSSKPEVKFVPSSPRKKDEDGFKELS